MDNEKDKKLSPEDQGREDIIDQSKAELAVEENKVKIISPGQMVLKRFFRSKLSVIGLVTLVVLFSFAIFGPFITKAAWGYGEQTADTRRAPSVVRDYEMQVIEKIETNDSIFEIARQCLTSGAELPDADDTPTDLNTKATNNKKKLAAAFSNGKKGSFNWDIKDENGNVISTETYWFEIETKQKTITIYLLDVEDVEYNGSMVQSFSRRITTAYKRTTSVRTLNRNASPTADHWLGTDINGYDVLTRLMYGGRISLTLSFIVVFIQLILGITFGGLAGYFGKWVDLIIMRITDVLGCLPGIPLMLIFSSILDGMQIDQSIRIFFLMGMLAMIGWTGTARTVRGQILMLREQEFMVAAEALGLTIPRRIIKHLIPNIMPLLIVSMTLGLGGVILSEATLSFLGLGIRPPQAAWGTMINSANDPIVLQFFPNQWVPAGVLIVLVVLAFNFVGDGLRDAFDPKSRR